MSSQLCTALRRLELRSSASSFRRHASHQAQGRANKAKQGPGKRLGAKKTGGEYVVTGNILYKQRGTLWFPGENCFMGRDHTIHAATPGYVRYYRDPLRHPKRQYIGVVLHKDGELPRPPNAPRIRRLGMLAYEMPETPEVKEEPVQTRIRNPKITPLVPKLRPGYQYRVGNYEIGREAERVGTAKQVTPFDPGNRWAAWRRRAKSARKAAEQRAIGRGSAKGGAKKKARS